MKVSALKVIAAVVMVLGMSFQAQAAPIVVSPSTTACGSPVCLFASGNENDTNDILDVIAGLLGDLNELYKSDQGGPDSGPGAGWYDTTYDPPDDPEDALIQWLGGSFINQTPLYLLVKDGSQIPAWYLFDISGWNGQDDIQINNFWPTQGAISHVAIYGTTTSVPDGGSTAALLGSVLVGFGILRRRFNRR